MIKKKQKHKWPKRQYLYTFSLHGEPDTLNKLHDEWSGDLELMGGGVQWIEKVSALNGHANYSVCIYTDQNPTEMRKTYEYFKHEFFVTGRAIGMFCGVNIQSITNQPARKAA